MFPGGVLQPRVMQSIRLSREGLLLDQREVTSEEREVVRRHVVAKHLIALFRILLGYR